MSQKVNTSFELDYKTLTLLQKEAEKLGFKSWGAYLRHVLDFHVLTFHPEIFNEHTESTRTQ
jgi:hypothetical protein